MLISDQILALKQIRGPLNDWNCSLQSESQTVQVRSHNLGTVALLRKLRQLRSREYGRRAECRIDLAA
jgi:hypothetical protein